MFGCLAISAQSAVAATTPQTQDLRTEVITVGHDAQVLQTVIIAEKQIIAEGVQLVPDSVKPLASHVVRQDNHILTLAHGIRDEIPIVRHGGNVQTAARNVRETALGIQRSEADLNGARSHLISAFRLSGKIGRASAPVTTRYAPAVILYDLQHAAATTIRLMRQALGMM